jgi:hypothetical protein
MAANLPHPYPPGNIWIDLVLNAGRVTGMLALLRVLLEFRRVSRVVLLVPFFLFCISRPIVADEVPSVSWKTATPESQGLDSAVLAEALDYVRTKRIPLHSF